MVALGVFVGCVVLVACSGAVFKPDAWYRGLSKPAWNPPDWAFGSAWSVLYVMIAVAGWRVWERAESDALLPAMIVYAIQLALNAGWSAVFFGLKRPDWALAKLACLWTAILLNIMVFYPIDPVAGWLLAPYLLWVMFAGALNLAVWRLNRSEA